MPMIRVPDTRLLGTRHPELSWQDKYLGCIKEQVNSVSICKILKRKQTTWIVVEIQGADSVVVVLKYL